MYGKAVFFNLHASVCFVTVLQAIENPFLLYFWSKMIEAKIHY